MSEDALTYDATAFHLGLGNEPVPGRLTLTQFTLRFASADAEVIFPASETTLRLGEEEDERAWRVPAAEILANGCNLDRKSPSAREDIMHLPPEQLVESILEKERRIADILANVKGLLAKSK